MGSNQRDLVLDLSQPCYKVNPGQRLDAVLIDKSDVEVHTFRTGPDLIQERLGSKNLTLKRDVIGSCHLWTGSRHITGQLFFSNELGDAYLAKSWTGLNLTKLAEE